MPYDPRPLLTRLWSRVDKHAGKFYRETECWEYTGYTSAGGYGQIAEEKRTQYTHRLVYELLVGPIPDDAELDHLCRNHRCCRPEHLEPVTHAENMRRGHWSSIAHCPQGHEYDELNTHRNPITGHRKCRACNRERMARVRRQRRYVLGYQQGQVNARARDGRVSS